MHRDKPLESRVLQSPFGTHPAHIVESLVPTFPFVLTDFDSNWVVCAILFLYFFSERIILKMEY